MWREEIFGPVLGLMRVANLTEALEVANSTDYALTGAIFSRSPKSLDRARAEFEVGNLYINRALGYLRQVRFNVRPEVTVFTLG